MTYSFTAPPKDPQAIRTYSLDWSLWLAEDETITGHEVTASDGVTVSADRIETGGKIISWTLEGGTPNSAALITVQIDTSAGQRDERTIRVPVKER